MNLKIWSKYLVWLCVSLLVTLATCGAFNIFMDPLGIFGSPRIGGINKVKPYLDHHRELARWKGAQRLCPNAAIFGNSRAEIGLDPEHPDFGKKSLRAFNHAIPGTSIVTAIQQLQWLQDAGCFPKTIVLGVEFFDFIGPAASASVISTSSIAPSITASVLAESVFSVTGVRDSLETLFIQKSRHPASITEKGFNPLLNYVPEVAHSGHYTLFRQRANENVAKWLKFGSGDHLGPRSASEFTQLQRFIQTASQHAESVHVVIYPYHAQLRLLLNKAKLGDSFLNWKASISSVIHNSDIGPAEFKLWDFSGMSDQTLEPIPASGDRRTHLQYYWEGGHFKRELGDKMLSQMIGGQAGFGVLVTPENLMEWLERDHQLVIEQENSNVALSADVESIFKQALAKRPASEK